MITKLYTLASILVLLTFNVCDAPKKSMEDTPVAQRGPKEGEWVSRRPDGSIKTRVNYRNGLKHGNSYLFYKDGKTVQLEMPYVVGARHGISKKYFTDGALYAETSYAEDELDGVRTTYYRNGKVKSTITYRSGNPGSDLMEYFQDGSVKPRPTIEYRQSGTIIRLSLDPPSACKHIRFFIGELKNGFFDESNEMTEMYGEGGDFLIDMDTYSRSYLALQDVICKCTSTQGNPLVLKTRIKR